MTVQLLDSRFLYLGVTLLLFMAWHIRSRPRRESRVRFSALGVVLQLPTTARAVSRPVVDVLRILALLAIVVALARPAVTRPVQASPRAGIDLVLALDISGSMAERDLGPKSRLETAKDVIQEFVAGRNGDRIGLVAFAGEAVAVSPLTQDYPVLLSLLSEINFDRLPQGTALGNGLAVAVNLVREGQGKSRVVILLTDGRSTTGDVSPENATKLAAALNVRTYAIGVGAVASGPAAPEGRRRFRDLDEEGLRRIGAATGGAYFLATDAATLMQIYATIDAMEKTELGTGQVVQVHDLSGFAVIAGAVFLMAELLLLNTVFRRAP